MLEVYIDNRNGYVWDISQLVPSLTYKTSRIGAASSLDLSVIKGALFQDKSFAVNNGDVIRVHKDGANVFYGYVFDVSTGTDDMIKIKAYDQVRYLVSNDTYVFKNVTATQIVKRIASDLGMETGGLAETGYVIPSMLEDNQKLLDIICKALDLTLIHSGRNFVFMDDFGSLSIKNIEDMLVPFAVGDNSQLYDYQYGQSIDSDTYNRVKIVQDNKQTGRRDVYISQDSANIAKWGRLQLFQVAEEGMNPAQISELVNNLMTLRNRESRKLQLSAIGDIRVRAGCYVPVIISALGIKQIFLVEECTHSIDGDTHTMTLEMKVI